MFNLFSHFRRVSLIVLIAVILVPFACQALLLVGLHRSSFAPPPSFTNDGGGHPTGARTLLRQINSQAQEDSDRNFEQVLNLTASAIVLVFFIFYGRNFFGFILRPGFKIPPSNRLTPLRI